ncbi:TIGR03767 family metallophosphoesterase [Tomitella fengzijianii]|uniref:TIGR03767 family metallophosphoesterase n=1 Tax=Tomitella fengzijianii TaxID=2597660 RepID=A0A516X0X1_9ACTN|nr:TIGR03767 family metallophosphoesterase [Tomitella fengzijianii]QDQ96680.1 TIGR03767 family metallophosphoesterase [Tomitella fengzijianii]
MTKVNRRRFLTGAGAGLGGALTLNVLGAAAPSRIGGGFWTPATAHADALAGSTAGTTLEAVATPAGPHGYQRLTAGPAYPVVVRTELAPAQAARADRRRALASLVQMTDMHILDAQSPVRVEFVHPLIGSASRPQDLLTTQGLTSLVGRINALAGGPHSGRRFDAVVTTGDNTDNHEHVELDWYLTALSGGRFTPNTGDLHRYEGTQDSGFDLYWNPESRHTDSFKRAGFPVIDGYFDAALAPMSSPGLTVPWFAVFGNHDDSVLGTAPSGIPPITDLYTSNLKLGAPGSAEEAERLQRALRADPAAVPGLIGQMTNPARIVTPDERRAPFTPREFMAAHFDPRYLGPGPHGHGFAADAPETGIGYYGFEIAPGVVGISMDSTNRGGFVDGSFGDAQFRWIEQTLAAGSSRYFDAGGREVRTGADDTLFVLFSHHTSDTTGLLIPDPENPAEPRHSGAELVALLHRFPNVCAWVNGHTHANKVTPHPGPTAQQGFWEVNTASHIDFPQYARVIEVVDNADGTLSLLATLIESDAPCQVPYDDLSPLGLASLYRELSYNDVNRDPDNMGGPADHNVELLLASPFA